MASRKIIWSIKAKNDLKKILEFYIERNGNKIYSIKLNEKMRNSIRLLVIYPDLGKKIDIENVRNLILGEYEIFYEIHSSSINILTIWDSRQNPSKLKL